MEIYTYNQKEADFNKLPLKFPAGSRSTSPASRFPARVPPRSQMSSRTVIDLFFNYFINSIFIFCPRSLNFDEYF